MKGFKNAFELGARSIVMGCAMVISVCAQAQTFDDYFEKIIVLAATKNGESFAMTSTIASDGYANKQEITINEDNEVVYLSTEENQKSILWYVGKNSKDNIYLAAQDKEKTYLYVGMTTGENAHPKMSFSKTNYFDFNNSYHTFTYTYDGTIYGILMQPSKFKLENVYYITDPTYLFPIAQPYFLADHTWRTLGSSTFGTICFPKAVRADERAGATFYEIAAKIMEGTDFKGIVLREVTGELGAGVPYIFKKDAEATYIVAAMHGDPAAAGSSNGLVGTLTDNNGAGFEVPAGKYILQGDQLWETTEGQSRLLAGRAYIDPDAITTTYSGSSSVKGLVLGIDAPFDGINATKSAPADRGIFDLQGRRVKHVVSGKTYLISGKKVYIQ